MATLDIADFRAAFPEFSDSAKFPDAQLTQWSSLASVLVSEWAWGDAWKSGYYLCIAHMLVMSKKAQQAGTGDAAPGIVTGAVTSKKVGDVSVGYGSGPGAGGSGSGADSGHWGATTYGQQFWYLSRLFGIGSVQV